LALRTAQGHFQLGGPLSRLGGERDSNFLATDVLGRAHVLKFINPGEPLLETQFQTAVLRHVAQHDGGALLPRHRPASNGQDQIDIVDDAGRACRVRAYSYLAGQPASQLKPNAAHRRALGRALAIFDQAMAGFTHPGVERTFLWDIMQMAQLAPHVAHIPDAHLRQLASGFIAAFGRSIGPALRGLRHQAIHNDLSQSNYLVSPEDETVIAGILDFGDMAHAPLLCDLAIAASYQMGTASDPLRALTDVTEGFEAVIPLLPAERELLLDAVLARVVQRLVLNEWRAATFPENRTYILRHTPEARRLLSLLEPLWRSRSVHGRLA
jgi:hydroxylysine kinase